MLRRASVRRAADLYGQLVERHRVHLELRRVGSTAYPITATIAVNCDKNIVPFTIALDAGANSAVLPNRYMKSSGSSDLLAYNIYTTVAHTIVFGDGTSGTATVAGNAPNKGVDAITSLYGLLTGGQDDAAGTYGDTVNITVTY